MHVEPFAARLDPHGEVGEAALEADFIGDHALERGDVPRAGGDPVAIQIEADGEVVHGRSAQSAIEPEPLGREDRKVERGRFDIDGMPEGAQRLREHVDADISSAALRDVLRCRGKEAETCHRPVIYRASL